MADLAAPGAASAGRAAAAAGDAGDAGDAGITAFDLRQFHQVFHEEAGENIDRMETLLLALDLASADDEALNAIFRCAHSVKGGAATFGFTDVAELTHEMETLLDALRRHELQATPPMVDVLLAAGDTLRGQLARHRGDSGAALDTRALLVQIRALLDGSPLPAAALDAAAEVQVDPGYGFYDDAPGAPAIADECAGFGFFDGAPGAPGAPAGKPASTSAPTTPGAPESSTLRVSVDKVDQLINLVGELVITQSMLAQTSRSVDLALHRQLAAGLADFERHTRELQEAVLSIRMIPMSVVFQRFPRMLRDLAARLGKKIDFVTRGEAAELDKGLVERVTDPLTHLVRNACDHGIERPEARVAAGKAERGTITLSASHQGGSIVIEVRDDGRGLSRTKLLATARERGINASDTMSDADVWSLIFAPGFSTAEQVSDVSGRGVGMDVVKRNITQLGGTVEIDSAEGHGMSVRVRLPLTLAIMDGMSVAVGSECYIVPLAGVIESFLVEDRAVRSIGGHGRVVEMRDEFLPVLELERVFDVARRPEDGPANSIMVIVEAEGSRVALLVDALLGQQQVVVKNLEANYRKVNDVSGATILGDGRVALILDVASLVRRARH